MYEGFSKSYKPLLEIRGIAEHLSNGHTLPFVRKREKTEVVFQVVRRQKEKKKFSYGILS